MGEMSLKTISGFTLIECILVLSLFSVVLSVVMGLYLTGYKMYRRIESQVESEDNVRIVLDRIAEVLRMTDNLPGNVSVYKQKLSIGSYRYSQNGDLLNEAIGAQRPTSNNLAHHIFSFEPSYENGFLTILIKGSTEPGSPPYTVERTFYIGGE
jgi:prepilin-type N-terminal cleavage/methylation domain-containing protein